jgi:hypothetical protein
MEMNNIALPASAFARKLAIAAILLFIANLAALYSIFELGYDSRHGLVSLFLLNAEKNIPTFFLCC